MNQFMIPEISEADRILLEDLNDLVKDRIAEIHRTQDLALMALLEKTMEETGLKASQLVLIQETSEEAIRFYFRPKEMRA